MKAKNVSVGELSAQLQEILDVNDPRVVVKACVLFIALGKVIAALAFDDPWFAASLFAFNFV